MPRAPFNHAKSVSFWCCQFCKCGAGFLDCSGTELAAGRLLPLRLCRGSISLFADVTLAVIKKILSCTSKKLNEQPADFLWLLLFNPVSGSVNKMDAAHLRTGGALHPLKRTGHLENAPVALAGNEE